MRNRSQIGEYILKDQITVKNITYAIGYDPAQTAPYILIRQDTEGNYPVGHSYTSESKARKKLFQLAFQQLPQREVSQIALEHLTQEDRTTIAQNENRVSSAFQPPDLNAKISDAASRVCSDPRTAIPPSMERS